MIMMLMTTMVAAMMTIMATNTRKQPHLQRLSPPLLPQIPLLKIFSVLEKIHELDGRNLKKKKRVKK
jgi:hypothetical protein